VARATVEQALREQRSRADALGNQIEQRDGELERMADAERQLRHEITSLSARLQSLQRIADENKELRSELRSQAAVIAASSRHQVAEARVDL
jgi:cell shape-determining protein MreC